MSYQTTGRLHKIFDTEQKSASFSARDFVVEVADGKFPQMIKFQLVQDKCPLIDAYAEGDEITVEFDLRGREWNGRYFTNLNAWRITRAQEGAEGPGDATFEVEAPLGGDDVFDDDIPF